jgi:alpha-L-rhamnosidase
MHIRRTALLSIALVTLALAPALVRAQVASDLLDKTWPAQWITCPGAPARDPVVLHFRKVLELPQVPPHFVVHVSADNQFLLFVNQQRVGTGPARGDLAKWRFETYDLAPLLHPGRNVLAATVWNFGTHAALAQMSDRAGFLLQGDGEAERVVDTNGTWEVEEEKGQGISPERRLLPKVSYFAAEPPEQLNAPEFDWSWNLDPQSQTKSHPGQNQRWVKAVAIGPAVPRGSLVQYTSWQLVLDLLPPMSMELVPPGKVVRANGIEIPGDFPEKPFVVAPHTTASVLLDASRLVTAYPELTVWGGAGASIRITYAEALYDEKENKGNRNEISWKHILGPADRFVPDGPTRTYLPLTWKTWRYLQLDVTTGEQPLQMERLRAWFTAFPFQERGHFESDDPSLKSIWEVGWRTARLDAHDTYMDTPYWERLQYIGDTRIQALISYTVAGDDRLARQAIQGFNDSRIPDGITLSRYPTSLPQYIPTFSLLWVGMVHDYWMYRDDPTFVGAQIAGTRTVLQWFLQRRRPDGLLQKLPWWEFADWAEDFDFGVPPEDADGGSAIITLQFIEALRYAADLEDAFGDARQAAAYREAAAHASEAVRNRCWSEKYGLLADTPAQKHFSQHANILGAWLDVIPREQQKTVLRKILSKSDAGFNFESDLPPISLATYYFRFYLARAVQHAGMGDDYIRLLQPWRDMLALGLTTWAEKNEPTRSDSHAWSAHPNFDLLTIVAGVRPASASFNTVTIEPNLGPLKHINATISHPKGQIQVEYTRTSEGVAATITLPREISGKLIWSKKEYPLHEGQQHLTLPIRTVGATSGRLLGFSRVVANL